jgi:hypothetical protein
MPTLQGSWILPVAAAVQALATVVLVGVTMWYVRLTRQLVENSRQELADARALLETEAARKGSELLALTKRLLHTLDGLPAQGIGEALRHSAMWSAADEDRFGALAAFLSFGHEVAEIVPALVWIQQLYGRVTAVSLDRGYAPADAEARDYPGYRRGAVDKLRVIRETLSRQAKT